MRFYVVFIVRQTIYIDRLLIFVDGRSILKLMDVLRKYSANMRLLSTMEYHKLTLEIAQLFQK